MKNFFLRALLFSLIVFLIDRSFIIFRYDLINVFAEVGVEKMKKISPIFNTNEEFDLLTIGSSHVEFGISPEILTENTKLKSLNIAYGGGSNIGLQLNLLNHILSPDKIQKPKVILYGIDIITLNFKPSYRDEYQDILIGGNSTFSEMNILKKLSGTWDRIKASKHTKSFIKIYGVNLSRYFGDIKKGLILPPHFRNTTEYDKKMFSSYEKYEISDHGWVKGYGILNNKYVRTQADYFRPRKSSIEDFNKFVTLCKENNIKLIFFHPPEHEICLSNKEKYKKFEDFMNKFSKEHNIPYLDYNSKEKFPLSDDTLFFDSDHLNVHGAKLLSIMLSSDLSTLL